MNKKTLQRQLNAQFYYKNKGMFGLAIIASLLAGALNLILSWILRQLVDTASGTQTVLSMGEVALIGLAFVLLCVTVFGLRYVSVPHYLQRALRQYREFAFDKLTQKSISSFYDESTATYLSSLTNDVTSIETGYLEQQLSLITMAVTFFGALAMMLWYSPLLTGAAIGITLLPLVASILTGNRLEPIEQQVSGRNEDFTAALQDCLSGFSVVKSFRAEREIIRLFSEQNRSLEEAKFGRRRLKIMVGMIGAVAGICAQLGVFLVGAWLALSGRGITAGTVILFVNLMNFIIQPIAELPGLLAGRKAARGLIAKLAADLEKHETVSGKQEIAALERGIRLEQVSFSYEPGKPVLRELSTVFAAGKAYAVVGGSGSGKSTLLQLLMAGRTDYQGRIFFDDTELREMNAESLYQLISEIQQNVFVFNTSIRNNVTMFRDFPQSQLDSAIGRAHLDELLLQRGEDYLCGENGVGLSGGEKQRISIARSLLKQSDVLLVDEATASLDAQTAYQVTSDLLDLEGITRIVVTHTLEESLLRRYDGIIVLKNGRIEESGRYQELMEAKGYFYALVTVAQ